jgi:hypothetical protein
MTMQRNQTATLDCEYPCVLGFHWMGSSADHASASAGPRSMVGRVIGKNGETIKALQTYTGALIQIDQTVGKCKAVQGFLQLSLPFCSCCLWPSDDMTTCMGAEV